MIIKLQLLWALVEVSVLLFRLQRSLGGSSYQAASTNSAILDKLWTRVQMEPPSKEELVHVSNFES